MAPKDFTNYTVNMPHQAAWLVYINGIEVPVVSVDVDFGVWTVPTLNLTMVPSVLLQRIGFEDRLQVLVCYLDEWFNPDNPEFKVLAEFEVVGWSYTNTGRSRHITLQCRSHTQIMEQLFFYYMSAVDDIVTGLSPVTAQNPNMVVQPKVSYPTSLFLNGLMPSYGTSEPGEVPTEEFVRGPFDFISNIFKALMSPVADTSASAAEQPAGTVPPEAASVPGRNFFARWMNFTDFRRRWGGLPFFDDAKAKETEGCFPLLKAVQSTEVMSALQQQIGQSVGHAGSMWDLLKNVYGVMYMELLTIPAPPIVALAKGTGLVQGPVRRKKDGTVVRNGASTFGGILHHIVKPQCIFGIPPTCNIVFPSMLKQYTVEENYAVQATRLYLGEKYMSNLLTAESTGNFESLVGEVLTTGYPPVVHARMKRYISDPKQNTKNFLVYPEELYKGPVTIQKNAPPWLWILDKQSKASTTSISAATSNVTGYTPAAYDNINWSKMGRRKTKDAIKPLVAKYAGKLGLPLSVVFSMIWKESGFTPNLVSWDGGHGLMQLQVAGSWTHPTRGTTKKTVDSTKATYRLARKNFGWGGLKYSQINLFDPDTNLKMGISLLHFYAVKRVKQVLGSSGDLTDLTDTRTKRGILSFKFGASDGSEIWKFTFKPGDDNVYTAKGKVHKSASKAWKRWIKIFKKFESQDLEPPATTAPNVKNAPAQKEPEPVSAEPNAVVEKPMSEALQSVFADDLMSGSDGALGQLFQLYARYEFYRSKFEQRVGGISMVFNPYIVPGFPLVVFDEKTSGFDTLGYVTKVSHSMSASSGGADMSTRVNFTYARTFAEYIKLLRQGVEEAFASDDVPNYVCGPAEPIPSVGDVFQRTNNAEILYHAILFPGIKKGASFVWEDYVEVKDLEGNYLTLTEDEYIYEKGVVVHPLPRAYDQFRSADAAMFHIARPVCTLRDYIELRHGKSIKSLIKQGMVKGMDKSFYSSLRAGGKGPVKGGATFWGRIDTYIQGPKILSDERAQRITNMGVPPDYLPNADSTWDIITAKNDVPQTRMNWDKALRKYRMNIRGEGKFAAPQK